MKIFQVAGEGFHKKERVVILEKNCNLFCLTTSASGGGVWMSFPEGLVHILQAVNTHFTLGGAGLNNNTNIKLPYLL